MKKTQLFLILILLLSLTNYSQETLKFKNKTYPATPIWNFYCEEYAYSSKLKVQIAKTENGAMLKLSIDTSNENLFIGDKILMVLTDGSLIYCVDKNIRESLGQEKTTYYFLTNSEINQLKKLDIENIRFQIIGKESKFSSKTGYFSASVKQDYDENKTDLITTSLEVKTLFKSPKK
jgi:Ni,Fe-hydrogenase maturation factor